MQSKERKPLVSMKDFRNQAGRDFDALVSVYVEPLYAWNPKEKQNQMSKNGNEYEAGEVYQGACKWFNKDKGFGFVMCDGLPDAFCHFSAIQSDVPGRRNLVEGQAVEFVPVMGSKGWACESVTPL